MKKALLLIALVAILSVIDAPKQEQAELVDNPFRVYFCPRQDCLSPMLAEMEKASSYIHCAFYELKSKEIVGLLAAKSASIDVKLIVDENNNISGSKRVPEKNTMHNKFCVIDGKTTMTGSLNPTPPGFSKNNNNLLIVNSRNVAGNYGEEFEELWAGTFGGGEKTRHPKMSVNNISIGTYFCPEDSCEARVISEIKNAKSSIYFMAFSFTSDAIADAILSSRASYRGIIEKSQNSRFSVYPYLDNSRLDSNPYLMHHKVFIIDNSTLITGSFNPTQNGNMHNDENIIIIRDSNVARPYLEEFGILWQDSLRG